ncbi:anti-sigma factor domain-containing protein [Streptomyces sp. MBT53]|uniref:anti-sigma factor n=1 Tax=Streptomyces sp. MBT53 TaxID=1488384 RepID=UPI0019134587|nr:anti-sigma factor [Streptomyces sp. MBT53]MBK6013990.1 anti-sigma factor [Streptomyces sp. MBT53]
MITDDLHRLTGAYALHALSDEENASFERHPADCEACIEEAAELSATAARLGLAVSVEPDRDMRGRVLRRITTVRQETPGERPAPRSGRAALRTRLVSRWALAACLAAAAALGGTVVWQHQQAETALAQTHRAEQEATQISAVLAAPDARTQTVTLPEGATGTVVVSHGKDQAVFVVSGMAQAPAGKVYQLWFDDNGTMRSADLMNPDRADQTILLRGAVDGASGMGITVEPAGGSKQPTTAPLALTRFPA